MIKKDVDCVNLDNEQVLIQENHSAVHTDDSTCEEQRARAVHRFFQPMHAGKNDARP